MMFRWLVCALLTAILVTRAAPAGAQQTMRFAVVIGNNHAEGDASSGLRYADDDAVATHRLLQQAGVDSTLLVRLDEDSRRLYPDLKAEGFPRLQDLDRAFA